MMCVLLPLARFEDVGFVKEVLTRNAMTSKRGSRTGEFNTIDEFSQ